MYVTMQPTKTNAMLIFLVMVYPLEVVFVPKSSTIMIEVGSSYTLKKPAPQVEVKTISEYEKSKSDEGELF